MDFEDKMHRQQFEEMYNQYQTPLRKLAYRYNVPVDDIEDMVHEIHFSHTRVPIIRWNCRRMRCANC